MNSKLLLPTLLLLSTGYALQSPADQSVNLTSCIGNYAENINFLYLGCYDTNGTLLQRYQRLFTNPLYTLCNQTNQSSLTIPQTMPQPMPGSDPVIIMPPPSNKTINCCNYYEKGAGYEFSVCDGIGAIIRPELIGAADDVQWASLTPDNLLAPVWTDLTNLLNNYCEVYARMNATKSSGSPTSENMVASLNIPWALWGQQLLTSVQDLGIWLGRYVMYLGEAQTYLSANFPGSDLLASVQRELANIDPKLNFTDVTYGELVADSSVIYAKFINWYGTYFGQNGLIGFNRTSFMDGNTTLQEFTLNLTQVGLGQDQFVVEVPNLFPYQFNAIAEWITTKFGGPMSSQCKVCPSPSGSTTPSSGG